MGGGGEVIKLKFFYELDAMILGAADSLRLKRISCTSIR